MICGPIAVDQAQPDVGGDARERREALGIVRPVAARPVDIGVARPARRDAGRRERGDRARRPFAARSRAGPPKRLPNWCTRRGVSRASPGQRDSQGQASRMATPFSRQRRRQRSHDIRETPGLDERIDFRGDRKHPHARGRRSSIGEPVDHMLGDQADAALAAPKALRIAFGFLARRQALRGMLTPRSTTTFESCAPRPIST